MATSPSNENDILFLRLAKSFSGTKAVNFVFALEINCMLKKSRFLCYKGFDK